MGPGTISARVGANIRRYRTERGMTQERLAEALTEGGMELSDAAVSRLEAGRRAVTVDHLMALAEVLDCSPMELLEVPTEVPALRLTPHDVIPEAMPLDVMRLLAGMAIVTPETQETLARVVALSAPAVQEILDRNIRPLLDAAARASRSTGGER